MGRTAVVFGPTGLVGSELVKELINDFTYDKIITVTRRNLEMENPKVEQLILEDYSHFKQLRDRLDAVVYYCCIGTTIKKAGSKEEFARVDLEIPKMIAQMADMLSINYMVVISSLGADPNSGNFYLRTKGEMEKSVRHLYSGNLKILRPSLLMGKRSEFRFGEKVSVYFMKYFGWAFAGPLKRFRGIAAINVARAMIKVSQYPSEKVIYESDEIYNLISND